ncbi:MAG: lysophospholipase [Bradymonadaceae bacterium]
MELSKKDKRRGHVAPPVWSQEALTSLAISDLAPASVAEDDDVSTESGYWITPDGIQLFWRSWAGEEATRRGCVALMHGYGEHSGRYSHVATALVRAGYNVMAIDARGHGRSTGIRAHVGRFHDYVSDLAILKRKIEGRWPHLPLFVFGHSNGGLIALRYALTHPTRVKGFIVTSPLCGIAVKVNPVKAFAGDVMSRLRPSFALPSGLAPEAVCKNPRVVEHYSSDPLVLSDATARWFTEVNATTDDTLARAREIDQPFLWLISGDDRVVDSACAERLFHKLGSRDRELEIYPDLYHEILNEEAWEDILRRIVSWMEARRERRLNGQEER